MRIGSPNLASQTSRVEKFFKSSPSKKSKVKSSKSETVIAIDFVLKGLENSLKAWLKAYVSPARAY
jgi:hypothetical protein